MPIKISKNRVALSGIPLNLAAEVDVASAATTAIGAAASNNVRITGTTTITSLGTADAGITRNVRFAGVLTLTHNATSLILPGGGNITTAANDAAVFLSLGGGNWFYSSSGTNGTKRSASGGLYAPPHAYAQMVVSATNNNQGIRPSAHTNVKFDSMYDDDWGMVSVGDFGFKIPATWGTAACPFGAVRFSFQIALAGLVSEAAADRVIRGSITNGRSGLGVGASFEMPIVTNPIPTGLRGLACASSGGFWDWDVLAGDIFTVDIFHNDPGTPAPTVVTFDTGADTVAWASHNLAANRAISFFGGTLPTELTANTVYYVRNPLTNTFQVSATSGGSVIGLSGSPSGTTTATPGRNTDASVMWFAMEMI